MASISDFVKIPKKDSCKHLSTGLAYSSFTHWAGFIIPSFSENRVINAGSDSDLELRKEISSYTNLRIASARDIFLLYCHSVSESVSENVNFINGTVGVDFVSKFNNASEFIDVIKMTCDKYSDKVKLLPYLGLDSDNDNDIPLATMLLESGVFSGIELYGTAFSEQPEKFLNIFNTAHKMGIETRICCLGFRKVNDIRFF